MEEDLKFDERGLIPVITQDYTNNEVLMHAWLNKEALEKTLATGKMHYWSREMKRIWQKGEKTGNVQELVALRVDCDRDSILARVKQKGNACHTNRYSCFFSSIIEKEKGASIIYELLKVLEERKESPSEKSYTSKLLSNEKLLTDKIIEESKEVATASTKENLVWELADLFYHCMVLMIAHGIEPIDIFRELERRRK
ncbi:MAG: bifunctional phosphoribosyl-AMP cyclohydrolase/phosphoribosyl-ATP diphosphatase HisIE [Candidatus Thermoplasmatota archaeon]|nr:bifunctional phosphoribosyl-AMP cyclohydrolase/phosphoribosyl-ATP diphosphatase HisIE [Candidatus Thermoplasmatota archaeon]